MTERQVNKSQNCHQEGVRVRARSERWGGNTVTVVSFFMVKELWMFGQELIGYWKVLLKLKLLLNCFFAASN